MSSHPQSPDSAKNPRELLEEAALACVLASSGDSAALERARTALAALCDGLDGTEHHELALLALTEVANERGNPGPAAERLRRAGEHLDVLQTQLEAPQADAPELLDPRVSTLPRHPSVRLAASERAEASRTNAPVEPAASATPAVAAPAPMAAPTPTAATPPSPAAPPSPPTPPSPAVRASVPAGPAGDPELLDLFGDFLAESLEGLDKTDEILLGAEQGLESPENVNALFRVFHTIKGVSAFLGATDVTALAHATESLLDQVRQGQKRLQGSVLDRAFEASSAMRRLLDSAREAVEQGRSIPRDPTIVTLISRINSSTGATVKPPAGASHAPLPNLKGQAPSMRPSIVAAPAPRAPEPRPAVLPAEPAPDSPALEHKKSTAAKAAPPSVHAPSLQDPAAPVDRAVGTSAAEPPTAPLSIAPAKAAAEGHGKIRETVKVDLERVDSVVEMVGELIIMESMVVSSPELASLASLKLKNYLGQLTKISRDLQDVVMRMRMVPVRGVFNKMARMVRDLGRKTGKLVQLVTSGENTEMDRSMVERLEDPLVHMIRNAIDHAIESPAERRELGKTAIGTLRLSATHEGGSVAIELTDDGRGLQRDAILKKARSKGLIPESNDGLTDREVFGLIFLPGFSTAAQVSELSGRGVGMDVVKRNIESMRGRVLVNST
ncbi:MAG TPA: chemotaxis protein CheA, partial [Polyangiaceae bacterium]|nr:chemotaxis protein CheA [Polyangiaceae bacterium]